MYTVETTGGDVITYIETPEEIDEMDSRSREASSLLIKDIAPTGTPIHCSSGYDLCTVNDAALLFIRKGIFKFYYGQKLIRLYQENDLFLPLCCGTSAGCSCKSEFGAELLILSQQETDSLAASVPDFTSRLLSVTSMQSHIMHVLCGIQSQDEISPDFTFKCFDSGTTIITEGEPAKEIYMLLSGSASVTVNNATVGNVSPGEVFGEISFFTSGVRSATVTATSDCTVQIMNKVDFLGLVKVKPSVNMAITKTLSERLIETNRVIAGQKHNQ